MIQEDKTSTKKMLSTKNNIYIGLCILYILLSMINRKYPIGDVTLHIVYLSTWFFLLHRKVSGDYQRLAYIINDY